MSGHGSPTERIVCPRCGGNNFATQAACWKCGAPLGAASAPAAVSSPPLPAQSGERFATRAAAPDAESAPPSTGAAVAAVALGFLLPLVAIPVGLIFIMLDSRRRIAIGWVAIASGIVFTIIHILVTMAMLRPLLDSPLIEQIRVPSAGMPSPDTPVPPLNFPQ